VFAPCGHHKKNAASLCCAEVEITLLSLDNLHSEVHWIAEDDLLRLFRQDAVGSHVANVRFVPSNSILGFNNVPCQVYSFVGTPEARKTKPPTSGKTHIDS